MIYLVIGIVVALALIVAWSVYFWRQERRSRQRELEFQAFLLEFRQTQAKLLAVYRQIAEAFERLEQARKIS